MAHVTLRYDLRAPIWGPASHAEIYGACLEQCAWADERGINAAVVSEHHGVDDGYLPSPLVMASAILGRTQRTMVTVSALLVPLHDPLRLAEDIAVLDLTAPGRIGIIAGLGYRPEEFQMFGVDRRRRGQILDEALELMLKAWTGEAFEHRGQTIRILPRPATQPHPLVLVGGSTPAAARRAARFHLPFMPAIGDPELQTIYDAACTESGFDGGFVILPTGPGFVHVTDDPERAWQTIAPHALHEAQTYAAWQTPGQRSSVHTDATTLEELKASGVYRVVTPDECVALAQELGPTGAIVLHPLMGGLPPALGWESLELFVNKVLPRL
jgi:alkanesulfonate monooxygenase SsuD/methylene tetrahydromethanopterin reductase-like flavin-dependent oxidoreductase (luciferase family)